MAIRWGSYTSGSLKLRAGIELTVSGTKITAKYYIASSGITSINDSMTLTMSGSATGSTTFWMRSPSSALLIATKTKTGSRGKKYTFGAKITGTPSTVPGNPSVSASITVPATKPSKPSKPTITAPSSSSVKGTLKYAPSNGGASITRYEWNLSTNSTVHSSGTTRYKTVTGLSANTSYRIRVRAVNRAGAGPWSEYSNAARTKPNKPNAPTNVTATRVSDTQQTVKWSASAATGKPITKCKVLRRDSHNLTVVTIATVGASTRTYTDKTTKANRRYNYWVETVNSAGASRSSGHGIVNTTPAAPPAPKATRSGTTVKLTFTENKDWPSASVTQYVIQDNPGGTGWVTLATISMAGTWTHQSPDLQVTHQYRVAVRTNTNVLTSAYSATTQVVQLLAPPAAPGNLTPDGIGVPLGEDLTLSFTHNPVDSSDSTKAQIRWREVGASTWTTPDVFAVVVEPDDTITTVLDTSEFEPGVQIEWQASTWGEHLTQGAWYTTARFTPSERPSATIETPEETWGYPKLAVEWGYFDPEDTTQSRASAVLENDDGIIETVNVNGDATTATFKTLLVDDATYLVTVTVWDGNNLASEPETAEFAVDYLPPAPPELAADFDRETGATILDIQNPEDVEDLPETVSVDIQRRTGEGEWVTVLQGLPPNSTTADFTMPLGVEVEYRAVAWSELPSSAFSEPQPVFAGIGDADAYLGGGPGFSQTVRLIRNPETSGQIGLANKVMHQFAGRTKPTGFDGPMTARELTWSGSLLTEEQSLSEFEDIAILQGQHMLRTPDGLSIAGQLDAIPYNRGIAGAIWGVSIKITETAGAN